MRTLADAAKYDPHFDHFVLGASEEARRALERFDDLDDLDQAVTVLLLARYAPNILAFAMDHAALALEQAAE